VGGLSASSPLRNLRCISRDATNRGGAMSHNAAAVQAIYESFGKGDGMIAVPVRLELACKASGKRIQDFEMYLWTSGPDGLVSGSRHFADTHQWAQATRA
jgi:hypothetical protein